MKKIYSILVALLCGVILSFTQAATIKVHVAQDGSLSGWNLGTVYFWVWNTGQSGSDLLATSEGNGWYSANVSTTNFLVKDQTAWAGDSHQSVDMTVSGDACYELSNGTSKKLLTAVSCDGGVTPVNPPTPSGAYYVAGNGVGSWCNGVSWDPGATANKMTDGSITFTNVPAGTYDFKITQGAWGTNGVDNWDYNYFNAGCSNVSATHSEPDWNIEFTTAEAGDITITFDGTKICVNATGGSGTPIDPPTPGSYYVAGFNGNWSETAYPMTNGEYSIDLGAGEHKFKVTAGTWSQCWGYTAFDASCSNVSAANDNDGNVVITLSEASVVTIKFDGSKICVNATAGGNGGSVSDIYLIGYIDGVDVSDNSHKFTDGSLSITFAQKSYVYIKTGSGKYYMASEYTETSPAHLEQSVYGVEGTPAEKVGINAGAWTITVSEAGTGYDLSFTGSGDTPINPPTPVGTYYITGESLVGSWDADAKEMTNGSIVFENLAAGEYAFKITQGDWQKESYGYDALGIVSEGLEVSTDASGNIVFILKQDATVTISLVSGKVNIVVEGSETPVIPVGPKYIEYSTATPAGIEDVMLQGFYWDSNQSPKSATGTGTQVNYTLSYYRPTRWDNLINDISDLNLFFDLIWLPPSAKSSGGLGYHPVQMSNQNGDMGTRRSLDAFIEQFHQGGGKVIADIVVNHRGNVSSWCDFATDRFVTSDGTNYGSFTFTSEHICSDDEMWTAPAAQVGSTCLNGPKGGYDSGEHYDHARDLDHNNAYVRSAIKAYLKWLRHEMRYDGFRWDVAGGFAQNYLGDYVDAAKPYISMAEKWEGSAQKLWEFIGRTGYKTGGLDFAVKYTAFNDGIAAGNYYKLKGAGLPGLGHAEYSVPFIDNHDTFERFDTQPNENNEFLGKGSFQSALKSIGLVKPTVEQARNNSVTNKVLQANAFLLGMPGTPCVFYPHWYSLKAQIKEMILARKAAGITNTSSVNDEAGDGYYKATIQGNRGELLLRVGPNSDYTNCPSGYTRMAGGVSGDNYAMFVKTTSPTKPSLGLTPGGGRYIGGTEVTMTATFGGAIYYTLDGSEPSSTNGTKYTGPVSITTNNTVLKAVAINAAGASPVQTHTYITENPVRTEPITIKFWKPEGWTACNIWAWNDNDPHIGSTVDAWPGNAAMTDDGNGWWTYTFDMSVEEITGLVFNDGTKNKQTSDFVEDVITESMCMAWTGLRIDSPYKVSCDYTALPEVKTSDISIYPNPATETLYITGENAQDAQLTVYDITGRQVMQQRNTTGSLQVNTLSTGMYILTVKDTEGRMMQHHFIKR